MKIEICSARATHSGGGNRGAAVSGKVNLWGLSVLAGVVLVSCWFWHKHQDGETELPYPLVRMDVDKSSQQLTAGTREVLQNLDAVVELRYYRLLAARPGREPLHQYATRVNDLMAEFERASRGKVRVIRITETAAAAAREAALAEGLIPVRLGRDEPELLGIVVCQRSEKVVFSRLEPKWEAALEFDLVRAISRVAGAKDASEPVANPTALNPTDTAELLRVLPAWESLTLDQARQQLREAALGEYQTMVRELQQELAEAQARVGDQADVRVRQELLQLQFQHTEKLNEIPRRAQAQLELVARLKQ